MSATNPTNFEQTSFARTDADYTAQLESKIEAKTPRHRKPIAVIPIAVIATSLGLALLLAGWFAVAANAQDTDEQPTGDTDEATLEECLAAARAAAGEAQTASNAPSDAGNTLETDAGNTPETQDPETQDPETQDDAALGDPFSYWCEDGGAREFNVVQDDSVDTVSISNTEPAGYLAT